MAQMRLDRFLTENKTASRSEAKQMIKNGQIMVNGEIVTNGACKIETQEDEVRWQNQLIQYEPFLYLMLYKPKGCVTANKDTRDKTVLDLIDEAECRRRESLFSVGRLDKNTEGLLLLTNDGPLSHELLSPRKHVEKTYLAKLDHPLFAFEEAVSRMEEGLEIGDEKPTLPAQLVSACEERAEYYLTITEGRFHQVKRMFQAVGATVMELKRVSFGPLQLEESLGPGGWRYLTTQEIECLKKSNRP